MKLRNITIKVTAVVLAAVLGAAGSPRSAGDMRPTAYVGLG